MSRVPWLSRSPRRQSRLAGNENGQPGGLAASHWS